MQDQAVAHSKDVLAQMRGGSPSDVKITSRYRPDSEAHKRGAIDITIHGSADPTAEARELKKALGKGFTVIVEKPSKDKKFQTNTYFGPGGEATRTETRPWGTPGFKADADHIHVQPNKDMYCRGAPCSIYIEDAPGLTEGGIVIEPEPQRPRLLAPPCRMKGNNPGYKPRDCN